MRLSRRGPVAVRPLPAAGGVLLALLGLAYGPAWRASTTLFSGNVLVQLVVARDLRPPSGAAWAWTALGLVGVVLLVVAHRPGRARADRRPARPFPPPFEYYPLVLLLGAFLAAFGLVFLFDASVSGDRLGDGTAVAFLYLDYAGIPRRPIQVAWGLVVLIAGLTAALGFSVRRRKRPVAAAMGRPTGAGVQMARPAR